MEFPELPLVSTKSTEEIAKEKIGKDNITKRRRRSSFRVRVARLIIRVSLSQRKKKYKNSAQVGFMLSGLLNRRG